MLVSTEIRSRQAREILRAGRHAWAIERDLNTYVVINFLCPEGDEFKPQREFQKIRTKARSWLYNKRGRGGLLGPSKKGSFTDPITDLRVWENANGRVHVNWPIHVPKRYLKEFKEKLPVWIEKVFGDLPTRCYKIKRIYNINGLMRYMLKGTEKGYAKRIKVRHSHQGTVFGRRAQASGCLGKASRVRAADEGLIVRQSSRFWKRKTPPKGAGF